MKSYVIIAILAALCLGGASQVKGAAVNYDNLDITINFGTALKMYFTSFQRIMPCGYPSLNIPILAPFTLDYVPINLTNAYYTILGNVSNLVVTGLNNFRILDSNYNTITNRVSIDLIFSEMQMLSEYEMNAMAYLAGFPATVAGSGIINYKIIDFRMLAEFSLSPNVDNPDGLHVYDFNLQFYFGDIIFSNWNTLWDISMNNFFNKIVREIALTWAQQIQVQVDEIYDQLVLPSILSEVSMTNLIDFFTSQSKEFNMVNCTLV